MLRFFRSFPAFQLSCGCFSGKRCLLRSPVGTARFGPGWVRPSRDVGRISWRCCRTTLGADRLIDGLLRKINRSTIAPAHWQQWNRGSGAAGEEEYDLSRRGRDFANVLTETCGS